MNQSRLTLKTIAIWQPYFMGGGAEAVSLWILEALAPYYDITLFTLQSIDLERLDILYNTHLSQQTITVKPLLPSLLNSESTRFLIANSRTVRSGLIHWSVRVFKELTRDYDLVLSTYNGLDMGRQGLQYLHWVYVVEPNPKKMRRWGAILMKISDFSLENLQKNVTLANSEYTAKRVKEAYGIESRVVYPPVVTEIDAIPWEQKDDAFLCSGRIVEPKQPHQLLRFCKRYAIAVLMLSYILPVAVVEPINSLMNGVLRKLRLRTQIGFKFIKIYPIKTI